MSARPSRSVAEWTTLAASCAVLLVVIVLVAAQMSSSRTPPAPVVAVTGQPTEVGSLHHVEVQVSNRGDQTAANVQISASLTIDGEETMADQTIDFLAGHDHEDLVFVFEDDPADGDLTITVSGFSVP